MNSPDVTRDDLRHEYERWVLFHSIAVFWRKSLSLVKFQLHIFPVLEESGGGADRSMPFSTFAHACDDIMGTYQRFIAGNMLLQVSLRERERFGAMLKVSIQVGYYSQYYCHDSSVQRELCIGLFSPNHRKSINREA